MNAAPSGTNNVKAYNTQHRPNGGKSSNNGNGGGYGKKVKSGGISKRGKGKGKGSRSKDPSNHDDICHYCKEEGHWKKGCLKHLWFKTQKKSKDYDGNNDKGSGPPGPSSASGENSSTAVVNYNWKQVGQCSRSFSAVTYFAAKLQAKSPNEWLCDTCCNTSITCFKDRIFDYREFSETETVVGFGGVELQAKGEGQGDVKSSAFALTVVENIGVISLLFSRSWVSSIGKHRPIRRSPTVGRSD